MPLKVRALSIKTILIVILIESQWNLNMDERYELLDSVDILIESQWNLNF